MPYPSPARYDYRYWQTKEAVTLQFAGTGSGADIDVSVAIREVPKTTQEKSPTGAQYLVSRTRWRIPGPILPVGTEIFPGDRIVSNLIFRKPTEGTGTWTILDVEHNPMDEVWILESQLLRLHPRLTQLITIQRPQMDANGKLPKDVTGAETFIWENVYVDEPAAVIYQGGDFDADVNKQVGERQRWLIVVGRVLTLTSADRVLLNHVGTGTDVADGDICLDIEDYQDSELIDELPHMVCTRLP